MRLVAAVLIAAAGTLGAQPRDAGIPHLRKQGSATQLIVDGKPFLILGGELGNSTASDLERMQPMWAKMRAMNLNTVAAPVYWEFLEPREGHFEFGLVDSLIVDARRNDMRLVLLRRSGSMRCMSSDDTTRLATVRSRSKALRLTKAPARRSRDRTDC